MQTAPIVSGLITTLALLGLAPRAVQAQANDMFPTKAAAEQRAKQLNCSGSFAMGSAWMPCKTFDAYQQAIQGK